MIEMHQGEEPEEIGDDELDEEFGRAPRQSVVGRLFSLASSGASLGIAALVVGFASLTVIQDGTELGDVSYLSHADVRTNLSVYKISSGTRLTAAVIALVLALLAAGKVFLPPAGDLGEDDESIADPLWVRAVIGAALVVALVAIIGAAVAFIYAMQAHLAPQTRFGG